MATFTLHCSLVDLGLTPRQGVIVTVTQTPQAAPDVTTNAVRTGAVTASTGPNGVADIILSSDPNVAYVVSATYDGVPVMPTAYVVGNQTGTVNLKDVLAAAVPVTPAQNAAVNASAASAAASAASAAQSASLVGAPADTAIAAAIGGQTSATTAALAARYTGKTAAAMLAGLLASDNNVKGDASTDDTAAMNTFLAAAAAAKEVATLAPNTTIRISTSTINVPSGTRLNLNGATIKSALPGVNDQLLTIAGKTDVIIWGGTLDGDKASFAPVTEFRHNIYIANSSRVTLRDITTVRAKGDGVFVGDWISGLSSDILLDRVTADSNHRQGLSVTSVNGLTATGCRFTNTSGTSPQSGVDIEPDTDTDTMARVKFVDCVFTGNAGYGLSIGLRAAPTSTQHGGDFIGCAFDANTLGGVYLNCAAHARFTGGSIRSNTGKGVWGSSATAGFISDVRFVSVDIQNNGGPGLLFDQPFTMLAVIGCSITGNTGIGGDFNPYTAGSSDLRIIGCSTGNDGGTTTQTYGYRTGLYVTNFTGMANVHIRNTTAPSYMNDDIPTRFVIEAANRLTVAGSRGGNAALAALLAGLAQRGIIIDSTTA